MNGLSPIRNVALIGAGGNLGSHVLRAFQSDASFNITVISRESSKQDFASTRVIRVKDAYPPEDMVKAFQDQDAVISMLNFRASSTQMGIIDAAVKAGVKRYIPSDFGANAEYPGLLDVDIRSRGNADIIEYLRSKEKDGLTWTCLITGLFIDMALKNGFMGYDVKNRKALIWGTGEETFSVSTRPWIAKATVAALKKSDETKNKIVFTSTYQTSQNEILSGLEELTGSKWTVNHVDPEVMIKEGKEQWAKGDFIGGGKLALAVLYSGKHGSDLKKSNRLNNDLLGLAPPEQSFKQALPSLANL